MLQPRFLAGFVVVFLNYLKKKQGFFIPKAMGKSFLNFANTKITF
jgi:hypothetical protein